MSDVVSDTPRAATGGSELTILTASISGNAILAAQAVQLLVEASGGSASIRPMNTVAPADVAALQVVLICSSTYGKGNVPDNGLQLYANLQREAPDLSHLAYGVIALGDTRYPRTFCNGGKRFDELFRTLGARRLGEILFHDASSGELVQHDAAEWFRQWLPHVESLLALTMQSATKWSPTRQAEYRGVSEDRAGALGAH